MSDTRKDCAPKPVKSAWPAAIAIIAIVALVTGGSLVALHLLRGTPGAIVDKSIALVKEAGKSAATVAAAFRHGTVRQEFVSHIAELYGTSYFQFATLKQAEVFQREESGSTAFGWVPLPKVVVQAQGPVEYTYYLDFNGAWEFLREGSVVTVVAPPISANTPALDVSELTFYTLEGSVWRDDKAVRERLRVSLSASLKERARRNTKLVREIGRQRLADFVEKWLAEKFVDGSDVRVKVIFQDEKAGFEAQEKPL